MAKKLLSTSFKNCQLDLENGTITEFLKEETRTYRLMDELGKFTGEGRFLDITLKESTEVPFEEE
jgi:hypothetical protein